MSKKIQQRLWTEYFCMKRMSYNELYKLRSVLVALDKPFIVRMIDMAISAKTRERDNDRTMIA